MIRILLWIIAMPVCYIWMQVDVWGGMAAWFLFLWLQIPDEFEEQERIDKLIAKLKGHDPM